MTRFLIAHAVTCLFVMHLYQSIALSPHPRIGGAVSGTIHLLLTENLAPGAWTLNPGRFDSLLKLLNNVIFYSMYVQKISITRKSWLNCLQQLSQWIAHSCVFSNDGSSIYAPHNMPGFKRGQTCAIVSHSKKMWPRKAVTSLTFTQENCE